MVFGKSDHAVIANLSSRRSWIISSTLAVSSNLKFHKFYLQIGVMFIFFLINHFLTKQNGSNPPIHVSNHFCTFLAFSVKIIFKKTNPRHMAFFAAMTVFS